MRILPLFLALVLSTVVYAQDAAEKVTLPDTPTDAAVATFRMHTAWLGNPALKGRLPGTPEMEAARDYVEYWLKAAGLEPAFGGKTEGVPGVDAKSYRQPFAYGGRKTGKSGQLHVGDLKMNSDDGAVIPGGLATKATDAAPMIFVGYGIKKGKLDYASFTAEDDLKGKVVVCFALEPMDKENQSLWGRQGGWSNRSSIRRRLRSLRTRGAKGLVLIMPPGVDMTVAMEQGIRTARTSFSPIPVIGLSTEAGAKLMKAADPQGRSLMDLRYAADEGRIVFPMEGEAVIQNETETIGGRTAENVGGLLRGKGKLAKEIIVVGAHIDHLGYGRFGSRSGGRIEVHPGADDNATGAAAVIMLANRLVKHYAELPDDADARSILFVGLDAEEQGLHGASYLARNPICPIENHQLMINFDMIGRWKEGSFIQVDGGISAKGFGEMITPILEASPLPCQQGERIMMASDHASFYRVEVPVLFSIVWPLQPDYHMPEDTVDKINFEAGALVVDIYEAITKKVAVMSERLEFTR